MGSSVSTKVHTLVSTAQSVLGRRKSPFDPLGLEVQRVLALLNPLPPLSGWFPKNNHPATVHIGTALKSGSDATAALLDVVTPVIRHLPWQHSPAAPENAPGLEPRAAVAEIIGPEAPFRHRAVRLGLALIAPNTHCAAHHHSTTELIYVITGVATWVQNGVPREAPPGTFIFHPPQSVHTVCTSADAILALYTQSITEALDAPEYSI